MVAGVSQIGGGEIGDRRTEGGVKPHLHKRNNGKPPSGRRAVVRAGTAGADPWKAILGHPQPRWNGGGGLFVAENDPDGAVSDAEFGSILQHGSTNAALFEKSAIGGIEIPEVNKGIANLEQAMVAGDFGVGENKVRTLAPNDGAALDEGKDLTLIRPGSDREDDVEVFREAQSVIDRW